MNETALLELIGRLYDTAMDPGRWPGFAPVLARSFGAHSATVQIHDLPNGVLEVLATTDNITPALAEDYRTYYHQHDVWVRRGITRPGLRSSLGQELVDDREFWRSVHYNEFCKQADIACMIGCGVPLEGTAKGIIGLHRPLGLPRFDEPDKRMMDLFLPHLQRALQLQNRLATARLAQRVTAQTLGRLDVGVVVLDERCRLVSHNAVAEASLRNGSGASIAGGELRLRDRRLHARLAKLVADAAASGAGRGISAGGVLAVPRRQQRALSMLICPLRLGQDGFGPARPMALVVVSDPERGTATPLQVLRQLHGLTRAEARLLAALLAGERLQDYAERNALAVSTVRNQLARNFAKTGTRRQAELIQLCLSDPVIRMAANRAPLD